MAYRTTPGIGKESNSNINPIYRAASTVSKYASNVFKEIKQTSKVNNDLGVAKDKGRDYPPNAYAEGGKGREYYQSQATAISKKANKQKSELFGSILQARRYKD